ncbi:hypothetical protein PENTCL1PPCAC_19910, partial [Pristionchus entomophagus]
IRVNSFSPTLGRPYCKRKNETTFAWYFKGEAVETATCEEHVSCSDVSPLLCYGANCDEVLTMTSDTFQCKEGKDLRIAALGVDTPVHHLSCDTSSGAWIQETNDGVKSKLPKGAELRCEEWPTIPKTALVSAIALHVVSFLVYLLFLLLLWFHLRKCLKQKMIIAALNKFKDKLNNPAPTPASPFIVNRTKSSESKSNQGSRAPLAPSARPHSPATNPKPEPKLTHEQKKIHEQIEFDGAYAEAIKKCEKLYPEMFKPQKRGYVSDEHAKIEAQARRRNAKAHPTKKKKNKGRHGRNKRHSKHSRHDQPDIDVEESDRKEDESIDEQNAKAGIPSKRQG